MTTDTPSALEFRQLSPKWQDALAEFFCRLVANGDEAYFHPHPLTPDEAMARCQYTGRDLYYIAVEGRSILGYGMLRGWDEGYEIPSLGIALLPETRGIGLAKAFMSFLHMSARRRGAKQIRLTVLPDNLRAIQLYEEVGYLFAGQKSGQLVGLYTLHG